MASTKKKPLVIVESPAKARTIGKFLGKDFNIEASVGHIRDLPSSAAEIPAKLKKEKWSRLGIDVEDDFRPIYVVPAEKKDQIKKLKQLLKEADVLYLATDEDREGESISWHLVEELKPKAEIKRLVFHEITKSAIQHALDNPRSIDEAMVEAQEARRVVDRLYGYSVSPLLWKKIRPRLSAGRVQSVAVRLVVERERERIAFRSAEYWDLSGQFQAAEGAPFDASLVSVGGRRVASGRDFEQTTGQLKDAKGEAPLHLDEKAAKDLLQRLEGRTATVASLEQKPFTERPSPPFTTSTLQQEAGKKLRFSAQRTMRAAQRLYENGFITYMRTDSTTLSAEAVAGARTLIQSEYGGENLPDQPRTYATKVKNAQEAHEAIRPAGAAFRKPSEVAGELGVDENKIYELVFKRTVASQMKDAKGQRTTLQLDIDDARFQATGKIIQFPGFRLAYVETDEAVDDKADAAKAEMDRLLPNVTQGDALTTESLDAAGHTTQPPARLTEASLVKELEARGIGRPSTYASIIETIQARTYCFKKGSALVPTFTAFAVVNLLEQFLPNLIDYTFTAKMEDHLDEISNGSRDRTDYLKTFYLGNGHPGLRDELETVDEKIDPREVCSIPLGEQDGEQVEIRVGRYGPFVSKGETRANVPDETPPDEIDIEFALELIKKALEGPKSLGEDPESGLPVFVKVGRFGPYFQLGDPDELDEKPKMASLLAGMEPETVTLDQALAVLALPREIGVKKNEEGHDEPILASNGRYGPYVKWGKETRSIPEGKSPISITLEEAEKLLAEPKRRGRQRAAPKVLKELGKHPESEVEIKILDGRYGPYITDGEVNATVPKADGIEDIDLQRAIDLLAEKAARTPAKKKKKASKKKAAKKTTAKKSTAKKSTAKKGTAKKKAATTKTAASKKSAAKKGDA